MRVMELPFDVVKRLKELHGVSRVLWKESVVSKIPCWPLSAVYGLAMLPSALRLLQERKESFHDSEPMKDIPFSSGISPDSKTLSGNVAIEIICCQGMTKLIL